MVSIGRTRALGEENMTEVGARSSIGGTVWLLPLSESAKVLADVPT